MTEFRALIESAGLSVQEAADFLRADERTVRRWLEGENPPTEILTQMFTLIDRKDRAAAEAIRIIEARLATAAMLAFIDLGLSTDDHEAQSLGWPTASAHAAVIRRVVETLPHGLRHLIRIVPRGSTVASAAAADSH